MGWRERRRQRREERRKQEFVREVAPLMAEGEQIMAAMMVRVVKEDLEAGRTWTDQELRKNYSEDDTESLEGVVAARELGMAMWAREKGLTPGVAEHNRVYAELMRRNRITREVLAERQAGEEPEPPSSTEWAPPGS